jgi:hypothetical protein
MVVRKKPPLPLGAKILVTRCRIYLEVVVLLKLDS